MRWCKLILSCPTCAGHNWEINGETGTRTTFHCESFKLEVMASCQIEYNRLKRRLKETAIGQVPDREQEKIKLRLSAFHDVIANGL